jgi:hypothetical protein
MSYDDAMRRPEANEYQSEYARYVDLVPETDIVGALTAQLAETRSVLSSVDASRAGHRYAEGKWSVREVTGHMSDAERVFGYRSFAISRGEQASLPSFDEETYTPAGAYDLWSMSDLIECFSTLRTSNLLFMRMLDEKAWSRSGTANGHPVTTRALAYGMLGHERHHLGVLRERYLR